MIKPRKLIWKFYFLVFTAICFTNLIWLLYPEADPYIFYHILTAWSNYYTLHYFLAILKSLVAIISLGALFDFSFNRPVKNPLFWQYFLLVRIILEVFGNFYEILFIRSSYHMVLGYGLTTTGVFVLPLLPSYIAHYLYAFEKDAPSRRI